MGYKLSKGQLGKAFKRFKKLADKKKNIFDEDLKAIVEDELIVAPERYKLTFLHIEGGTEQTPLAKLRLKVGKKIIETEARGDGPVDACYKAIDKITKASGRLVDYSIRSVTSGKDALGEASVKVEVRNQVITGTGTSTDVIEASVKAYLNVMNKIASQHEPKLRQHT